MYTVDDQGPYDFVVSSISPGTVGSFNQMLFETGQLSPGQHDLVVTYLGSSSSVPMGFNYFIQRDGTSSTSSSTPTSTFTSVFSSTPTGIHTDAIIGGVIGGLVLISLLLALFFFNRRRNNRRSQALSAMSYPPSPDVVNPFTSPSSNSNSTMTFLPQNYTLNGQSLSSQSISSKFSHRRGQPSDPAIMSSLSPPDVVNPSTFPSSNPNSTMTFLPQSYSSNGQSLLSQSIPSKFSHQRGQPPDPASTGTSSGGGIPPSTPLRPQFSSPAFTPSVSSPLRTLPLTGSESQTNPDDGTRTRVPPDATVPSVQRSPSPQGANVTVRFLQHDDSGVRIPAEDEVQVVELPPVYSPE
jgi:hypothetical protein